MTRQTELPDGSSPEHDYRITFRLPFPMSQYDTHGRGELKADLRGVAASVLMGASVLFPKRWHRSAA